MRWYKIVIDGGQTWDATGDPNALEIKLDIPVAAENAPKAGAYVQIWGIPLDLLLKANQLTNKIVKVYGGMQKGLPLANPNQAGLLCQGKIFPALGNWQGVDMTLDLYIPTPVGGPTVPQAANVVHKVAPNTPLSGPLKQTLQSAFPGYTVNVNISDKLVRAYEQTGFYQTLGQYSTFLFQFSKGIIKDSTYLGVHTYVDGTTINVYDGTTQSKGGVINFVDLIGQPIWTGVNTCQIKTVMRGDLKIGQTITLPKSLATQTNTGSAFPTSTGGSGSVNNNIIQGSFTIQQMRHTGDFRQPDAASWCTTIDAISNSQGSGTPSGTNNSGASGGIGHA